jgi:hypothetical protein
MDGPTDSLSLGIELGADEVALFSSPAVGEIVGEAVGFGVEGSPETMNSKRE